MLPQCCEAHTCNSPESAGVCDEAYICDMWWREFLKDPTSSLIVWRQLVLDISKQRDPHLRRIISSQHITDKMCFDLHLHLEGDMG